MKNIIFIVATNNATLDTTIKAQITTAITSIEAIPGTFTDAIVNNRPAVQTAQAAVIALSNTLETSLKTEINGL